MFSNVLSKTAIKCLWTDSETIETLKVLEVNDLSCPMCEALSASIAGRPSALGGDLLRDVEMVECYKHDDKETVMSSVCRTMTKGGQQYFKKIITNPICDPDTLKRRSKDIMACQSYINNLHMHLGIMQKYEGDVAWVFNSDKEELKQLYDIVYFTSIFTKQLNKKPLALTSYSIYRVIGSTTIGIVSPLAYVIIPYLIIRHKIGANISLFSFVKLLIKLMLSSGEMSTIFLPKSLNSMRYVSYLFTLVFYFQGIFNSIELAKAVHKISKVLTEKMNGFILFIKSAKTIYQQCSIHLNSFFSDLKLPDLTTVDTFEKHKPSSFSIFKNFGFQLSTFRHLNKEMYSPLINCAYACDAILSITRLKGESFTSASYINAVADAPVESTIRPFLRLKNSVHPSILREMAVPNTVVLGGMTGHTNNIIITGPNAGGKSTLAKMILVNTILAQTITVVPAEELTLIPFALIKSQINIPDCKGKESLFEAEMYRSKENLELLGKLPRNDTALIVMDEIFNSTNPVEGIAGAYAIAKHMSMYENSACVYTTHYLYLTKLASEFPKAFKNYKMNVEINEETGDIVYPYKLKNGISKQFIALELLRKNGFDKELVDDAIAIKLRLTNTTNTKQLTKQ